MTPLFRNRVEAGRQLAKKLNGWAERDDTIVLALPRGGVPVAFEVAQHIHAPLDLMLVRKLGVPGHEELAMGALAPPDVCVFNRDVIRNNDISQMAIDAVIAKESAELSRRNQLYRGGEPPPNLEDRVVIVIDDGMATGATMRAAVSAVLQQMPLRTIVAAPVASKEAAADLCQLANEVVCLQTPEPFFGVGEFYQDFGQTSDEEVIGLIERARHWGHGRVHFPEAHEEARFG